MYSVWKITKLCSLALMSTAIKRETDSMHASREGCEDQAHRIRLRLTSWKTSHRKEVTHCGVMEYRLPADSP